MKKHFLKGMTDYVMQFGHNYEKHDLSKFLKQVSLIVDHANFLKQQPILGHFVPCDLDGNVLPVPSRSNDWYFGILVDFSDELIAQWEQYKEAKERVLFKGIEFDGIDIVINGSIYVSTFNKFNNMTIESLVYANLELTDNAAKMLGYESDTI